MYIRDWDSGSNVRKMALGRGLGIQILPYGINKWAVVELQIIDSALTVSNDFRQMPGDSMFSSYCSGNQSIKMETQASGGNLIVFDTFESLEDWLKTKCNELWPNCEYCGLRYVGNEVTCAGCGGPRG